MKNSLPALLCNSQVAVRRMVLYVTVLMLHVVNAHAQCVPVPNTISGIVFIDVDKDGAQSADEAGQSNVLATAYDADGNTVGSDVTDENGLYQIADLTEGDRYQIIFSHSTNLSSAFVGEDNKSAVQYHVSPVCEAGYALQASDDGCGKSPRIITSCFAQSSAANSDAIETLVSLDHNFTPSSYVDVYATQGETGAVWGLAWKHVSNQLFSAAFVKFNSSLKYGPYAILSTDISDPSSATTKQHTNVNELLGNKLSGLTVTDASDCSYGDQVGRVGLGNMIISSDESRLYVSVLDNNTVVSLSSTDPTAATTVEYAVPAPRGLATDREWKIFALSQKDGLLYVGGTITAAGTKKASDSGMVVWSLDPKTGEFEEIFSSSFVKGYWQDDVPEAYIHGQWLTDIEFADEKYMMLGLTDRLGHRYCKPSSGHRLDQQFPDLLGVWYDENSETWTLESNGSINGATGTGVGNGQGPDGGEFFGMEFWPTDSEYHNETALGSIMAIPSLGQVVAAVYDPLSDSYSAGLHRYSTSDGALIGAVQLYNGSTAQFGKATGFGDIVSVCDPGSIQIGNYVWFDENKNGVQDAGESGLAAVPLELYNSDCQLIGSTVTDAAGNYSFHNGNVAEGVYPDATYYVKVNEDTHNTTTGLYTIAGQEYSICTAAAGDNSELDCDITSGSACSGGAYIEVNTSVTNHSFDIGFTAPGSFDLALTKTIVGDKFIKKDELITFNITVHNQGGRTVSEVDVVDYITDGYVFDESQNLNWELEDGQLFTTFGNPLLPGMTVSRLLRLGAVADVAVDHQNYAEISSAYDLEGLPVNDVDSKADNIADNDAGGEAGSSTDDFLLGDGQDDEDDHDPAQPGIFDLAVRVMLADDKPYFVNEVVKFDVIVYNQGNTDASEYALTQYADTGLRFVAEQSQGWELSGGYPTLEVDEVLEAGEQREFCIYYRVGNEIQLGELMSFVEISKSIPVGGTESFDFDSTPDAIDDNDSGAEPYTNTDNSLQGNGDADEDDHDVVLVRSSILDLALTKSVIKSTVRRGEEVTWQITVHNQGTQPIDRLVVSDYMPAGLELADSDWDLIDEELAQLTIDMEQPLIGGASIMLPITTVVRESATGTSLVNFAEITSMSYQGVNLDDKDVDSTPDASVYNDAGGQVGTETDNATRLSRADDEDDHDPARIYLVSSSLTNSVCWENASTADDGQFLDQYEIISKSNDTWSVDQATNYFTPTSMQPPAAPVPVPLGNTMIFTEVVIPPAADSISRYTISLLREHGATATVSFRNADDEIETYEQGPETYTQTNVAGETALCSGGTETYTVTNPVAGVTYTFTTPGNDATVVSSTATTADINFDAAGVGTHRVVATPSGGCIAPGEVLVANGETSGAMFCLSHVNLSLDGDCSVTVTPQMLLSGGMPDGAAYSVMLLNEYDEVIPNATLNSDHIGQTVTAKVVDGCSGNSCWATMLVEDKLKPTIVCPTETDITCNKVSEYPGPTVQDNCGGEVTIELIQDVYTSTTDCNPDYLGYYTRRYQATDAQGNKSDFCDIRVNVERVDLEDVAFPANLTVFDGNALNCTGYEEDEDGAPSPFVTGRPVYSNKFIFPQLAENALCEVVTTYDDLRIPTTGTLGGVVKYMRTWTVYEWCSNPTQKSHVQMIEIKDVTPPVITECPDAMTVAANGGDCQATFTLPLPVATDECGGTLTYSAFLTDMVDTIFVGQDREVTLRASNIVYKAVQTVTDNAGLSTSCIHDVTVADLSNPVVACNSHTIIGLNDNGEAYAYASVFDAGSYDPCGIDSMKVQRLDADGNPTAACGYTDIDPADRVYFCCEDVGETVMVMLTVWDMNGNSNFCMVEVEVQDKAKPEIGKLDDVQIECGDDYFPLTQFGAFPAFNDACSVDTSSSYVVDLNSCGLGTITRTFVATDGPNTVSSTQTITVVNSDPFDLSDVTRPLDFDTEGVCDFDMLHPDSLAFPYGRPTYDTDHCAMVGDAFVDEIYDNGADGRCATIVRVWTVTDWCQETNPGFFSVSFSQIITVTNFDKPTIDTVAIPDVVSTVCDEGTIELSATGSDSCGNDDQLSWSADIFVDGIGVADDNPDVEYSGQGAVATADGTYPLGTHVVKWTFTDLCGNTEAVLQEFTIRTEIAPVLPCVNLSLGLGPMDLNNDGTIDTEMACFNVDTLLSIIQSPLSIYHPCGVDFELSCSLDSIVKKKTFDCSNIGDNQVTVYAIDIFGNSTSCEFIIDVQDNNDVDICIDPKECADIPEGTFDLEVGDECEATVVGTIYDPVQVADSECGELLITHNYGDAPSNTTLDGASFAPGTYTVMWTITVVDLDQSATCAITFEVTDDTDPTATCADLGDLAADADCMYTVDGSLLDPITDDNCTVVSVTHDLAGTPSDTTLAGAVFEVGSTTVTWTVTDMAGNTGQCTHTIVIADQEDPILTCTDPAPFDAADDNVEDCFYQVSANDIAVVAEDSCSTVMLAHDYFVAGDTGYQGTNSSNSLVGALFPIGNTPVLWVATDASGNTTECTITVTVTKTTPPSIVCGANVDASDADDGTLDCLHTITATTSDPVVSDDCSEVTVSHDYPNAPSDTTLVGATFPLDTTVTITWTVDNGVTTSTCTITVETADDDGPECLPQAGVTAVLDDNGTYTVTVADISNPLMDNCGGEITYEFTPAVLECDQIGSQSVTFTATDESGNTTTGCTIPFEVVDETPPAIVCSPDTAFFEIPATAEDCSFTVTTEPFAITATDVCDDNVSITHNYDEAPDNTTLVGAVFGPGTTIIQWIATDNSSNTDTCEVVVVVNKNAPPVLTCTSPVTLFDSTDGTEDCAHTVVGDVLDPTVTDQCGGVTLTHDYTAAPSDTTLAGAVFAVPDSFTITWTAVDLFGNTATCEVEVTTNDDVLPVCVEQDTVLINIDTSGVYNLDVSDLSSPLVDNCDGINLTYFFGTSLTCEDLGDTIMVPFTATDMSGNESVGCPLVVIVNESGMPECNPIDITVNLDANGSVTIDPTDVNNINMSACGISPEVILSDSTFFCNDVGDNDVTIQIVNGMDTLECIAVVTVTDTIFGPQILCEDDEEITCIDLDATYGGDIEAWMNDTPGIQAINDNCPESPMNEYTIDTILVINTTMCGLGESTRTFVVTDQFGMSSQCVQIFTVTAVNQLTQADIDGLNLPTTVEIEGCAADLDLTPNNTNLGQITVDSLLGLADCFDVEISFVDEVEGDDCSQTITRTWTINDLCQPGEFTFVQTIIVVDSFAPVIMGAMDVTVEAGSTCTAFVNFAGLTATDCNTVTGSNNGPFANDPNSLNPTGTYDVGNYEILIAAVDACGNEAMDTINLSVIDGSDFTIQCRKLFPQIFDDQTLTVTTRPRDYLLVMGACDDQLPQFDFTFTIDDLTDTTRVWGCEDVDVYFEETMYWFDQAGNFIDSCLVATRPQDPTGLCNGTLVGIGGTIVTEAGDGIDAFEVDLMGAGETIESNHLGEYAFGYMQSGGHYEVVPHKDGDDRNGVNVIDLIKIQRHLLDIEPIVSPYRLIAADVNSDERVSSADILALRRLLLGVDQSFTSNTSWRTVDAQYTFPDEQDPWAGILPESYEIDALSASMWLEFIGIKVGDVDNTVSLGQTISTSTRSSNTAKVLVAAAAVQDEVSTIAFEATTAEKVYGAQITLELGNMELLEVTSDLFATSQIAYHEVQPGIYTIVATTATGVSVAAAEEYMKLHVAKSGAVVPEDEVRLADSKVHESKLYLGAEMAATDVVLTYESEEEAIPQVHTEVLTVDQNRPNPWTDETEVRFSIPSADVVIFTVYDVNGRQLYRSSEYYEAGTHSKTLGSDQLSGTGILYYQVNYRSHVQQQKMIKID